MMNCKTEWRLFREALKIRRIIVGVSLIIGTVIHAMGSSHFGYPENFSTIDRIGTDVVFIMMFTVILTMVAMFGFHIITGIPIDSDMANANWYHVTENFRLSSYHIRADAWSGRQTFNLHLAIPVDDLRRIRHASCIKQWLLAKLELLPRPIAANLPLESKRFYIPRFVMRQIADDSEHLQASGQVPQFIELRFQFIGEYQGKKDYEKMQSLINRRDADILRELIARNGSQPLKISSAYTHNTVDEASLDSIDFDRFSEGHYLVFGEADIRVR